MSGELKLDVDQAGELKAAFRREGPWTNEKIKILCEQKGLLTQVLEVLEGRSEICPVEYTVDLDSTPFIPEGWKVEEHKKGGQWKFDPTKLELYLDEGQKNGKCIEGNKLRKKLESKDVLNANLLDFLLKNPNLIPESWKGKVVFFWGTIYRGTVGNLCVRDLCWRGSRWDWDYYWLDDDWNGSNLAVVLGK